MFSQDLENMEGLHHLYEIFRNIFLLNKNALFEIMFSEETIFDVVGCLEFEPGCATPKRHREYLKSMARFHQVFKLNIYIFCKLFTTTMHILIQVGDWIFAKKKSLDILIQLIHFPGHPNHKH